ncbi:MAG TPA: cyclic nucleotide-binding domain-containing protein [Nocardioidaceae bacterium]|nr:cyclic nucleotide-binding domain-containing protein [Nocardioidaceae bacterium]
MFNRHGVPQQRLDSLGRVPLFDGLSDEVLARIAAHVTETEVPSGSELTKRGQGSREAFIVEDGVAEVRIGDDVVADTRVGDLIGELGVLRNAPRSATVVAKTPMHLLVLSVPDLHWLADEQDVADRVRANFDRHLGDLERHLGDTTGD